MGTLTSASATQGDSGDRVKGIGLGFEKTLGANDAVALNELAKMKKKRQEVSKV